MVRRARQEAGGQEQGHGRARALPGEVHDGEEQREHAQVRRRIVRVHGEQGVVPRPFQQVEARGYGKRHDKGAHRARRPPARARDAPAPERHAAAGGQQQGRESRLRPGRVDEAGRGVEAQAEGRQAAGQGGGERQGARARRCLGRPRGGCGLGRDGKAGLPLGHRYSSVKDGARPIRCPSACIRGYSIIPLFPLPAPRALASGPRRGEP